MNKAIFEFDSYLVSYRVNEPNNPTLSTDWTVWNSYPLTLRESTMVVSMLENQGYQTKTQYNGEQMQ